MPSNFRKWSAWKASSRFLCNTNNQLFNQSPDTAVGLKDSSSRTWDSIPRWMTKNTGVDCSFQFSGMSSNLQSEKKLNDFQWGKICFMVLLIHFWCVYMTLLRRWYWITWTWVLATSLWFTSANSTFLLGSTVTLKQEHRCKNGDFRYTEKALGC